MNEYMIIRNTLHCMRMVEIHGGWVSMALRYIEMYQQTVLLYSMK